MRAFIAFCRKEILEVTRTYRLWIMLAVFAVLGILSPGAAKLLPAILNGVDMGGGVTLNLPEPTVIDSWTQFFKNISQMGGLVLVIVFAGLVATELSKGTLVNVLTKGAPRAAVLLAKFVVASATWVACFGVALCVTWAYNYYFWGATPLPHVGLALICLAVLGPLLIACMILGGLLTRSIVGSLVAVAVLVVGLNVVNIAPGAARYNPISLATNSLSLMTGAKTPADLLPALWIGLGAIVAIIVASLLVFDKKQI